MSIITLITDFGYKDASVAVWKAKLLSQAPHATIVDISHDVELYNIYEASFLIEKSFTHFPKKSIHLVGIDVQENNAIIILYSENQILIAPDNGVLFGIFQNYKIDKIIVTHGNSMLTKSDSMLQIASFLANGGNVMEIGIESTTIKSYYLPETTINSERTILKGEIIYIDHFGNCITNITKKIFADFVQNQAFEIAIRNRKITKIHTHYSDFKTTETKTLLDFEGDLLALFNASGNLEIAIYKGNPNTVGAASTLFGLQFRDSISIQKKGFLEV